MSQDSVILNLDAVKERFELFNSVFPNQALHNYYLFDFKKSAEENLNELSQIILNEKCSIVPYLFAYKNIFLQIMSHWTTTQLNNDYYVKVLENVSRIITMYPLSMPIIEEFLVRNNNIFISMLQNDIDRDSNSEHIFKILLSYYRLIFHNKDVFNKFINPQLLYSTIENTNDNLIKFISLKILSLVLDLGEKAIQDMIRAHLHDAETIGEYELDSNIDYKFLELNEAKRFSNFSSLPCVEECFEIDTKSNRNNYYTIEPKYLNDKVVSICGVLVPRVNIAEEHRNKYPTEIVPTKKTIETVRDLAKVLQKSEPIMLLGKAGSGKTFLINELSKYIGSHDSIVKIHLGEQTDAKLLIGTYTSGEKPGTFEWRAGVLTTAVKEGRWVLIEDIDKAPTEVLSILLSLLEKRELTIPSRGETIKAANGFQLISTVRLSEDNIRKQHADNSQNKDSHNIDINMIGMRIWNKIVLDEPSEEDLHQILVQRYPILSQLIPKLIQSYESVKNIYLDSRFVALNKGAHSRVVSVRDLVKLCNRLNILFQNNNIKEPNQLIESSVYDSIFAEASDCFAGAISEYKALEPLIHCIGESLEIANSRISLFLTKHVPQLENFDNSIKIGRAVLPKSRLLVQKKSMNTTSFAFTNHSLRLMEQISVSIQMNEPVLLVGETGTGKTTVVQQVAKLMNKPLTVINVSQQTETGDLLGGYKPVNSKSVAVPVQELFESLFATTFSLKKNERFYKMLHKCFNRGQWKNVVKLWKEAYKMAKTILKKEEKLDDENKKKKRKLNFHEKETLLEQWSDFNDQVDKFQIQSSSLENSFVFNFVEGSLVKAVRNGEWLLLDEVNLASADTLESISDLLAEESSRSILLSEKGDAEPIKAHPEFRIFACMNPATDVGKRDLPSGIRSRFTEIYVHSPDRDITDLLSIIDKYIGKYSVSDEWVGNDIAELYLEAKKLAESNKIVDGSNQKPHFSIRSLTRTLLYVCDIVQIYGLRRSLYDGFCMTFLTLLDQTSEQILKPIIEKFTIGRLRNPKSVLSQAPANPGPNYVQFKHYWMRKGLEGIVEQPNYIITPFVEKNMMNLVRATSGKRFPVLVQGPTSAGKTSMIKYLADITGHKFVRINNHEHTDLQEYLGTYVTDDTGKLTFKEGVLVEALRKGYWIVLDELNLAPTDVLEALNRLLDDNRELFIPETQEVVHPHEDFMLFATQNPPGIYGGRKVLSRAFRNRFLELHFDDIPQDELEIILRERCQIAPSYAKKIVEVYRQLSVERSANRLFEQKNSFATLRDLFRWALRDAVGYDELAANGYMLLAERCRNPQEKVTVKNILEKVMKVKLDMESYYHSLEDTNLNSIKSVVWTNALRRLAVLVSSCLKNNEPILLVGETGCGKTTICQLLAEYTHKELITLNAHQNTETGDILGAQRPRRNRSDIQQKLTIILQSVLNNDSEADLSSLLEMYESLDKSEIPEEQQKEIKTLQDNLNILFEWCDGPLIQALKGGNFFLLDEISLADDSVLERLNSVLEPERSLLLAEKGSSDNFVVAKEGFQFFATMNPGGDYGKKELSPALRNRFTEIWVPSMEDFEDVRSIVKARLSSEVTELTDPIVLFSEWFGKKFGGGDATNGIISLRDILAWVDFVNSTFSKTENIYASLVHGALMVFIDALGTNNTAYLAENEDSLRKLKAECVDMLSKISKKDLFVFANDKFNFELTEKLLKIGLFSYPRSEMSSDTSSFNVGAPTTSSNLMRVIRAMQVHKPILLEGSPGVGKTSLITALADLTGNELTRINLSEQTDLVDLFGSDAPGEKSGEFVWHDAPFLRAMQQGNWVLLDEMNLASQSVLEGLNACLDHRGEAYIPELDKSFICHPNFVVFAAQNPQYQGGGRKGLPKSFVNRFSVVFIEMLNPDDLLQIAKHLYPDIASSTINNVIELMSTLENEVTKKKSWGISGAPWEFNLRDALRWLKLLSQKSISNHVGVFDFFDVIIRQRFRTEDDRSKAQILLRNIFGENKLKSNLLRINESYIQINNTITARNPIFSYSTIEKLYPLESNFPFYESALKCINNNWPLIIVGPTNSGKTELVRYLATVVGAHIDVFSMNNDVDSMDILGGYEQVDMTRKISSIVKILKPLLLELIGINLCVEGTNSLAISTGLDLFNFIAQNVITKNDFAGFESKFNKFYANIYDNIELAQIAENISKLKEVLSKPESVTFEWFDGMLINAVEQGHWLILDNANLCSPSVLDRLNSLLETDGSLLINECSQEDGQPRILRPHPNFRLFLTMDPKYGELSRAMRNRGIELFIEDLESRSTSFDRRCLDYNEYTTIQTEEMVTRKLSTMNFTDGGKKKPLKCFIPSCLSKFNPFEQIHDIISMSDNIVTVETLIGLLPFTSLNTVENWNSNINNNRHFSERKTTNAIKDFIISLTESGILKELNEIALNSEENISSILSEPSDNLSKQPIMLILNDYLLSMVQEQAPFLNSSEGLYLFTVVRQIIEMNLKLQSSEKRSLTAKIEELSYLEKSAAVNNGRYLKSAPRIPIFSLLCGILSYCTNTIKASVIFSHSKLYTLLNDLLIIADAAYKTAQAKDEARLRVYKELFENWVVSASKENIDTSEFSNLLSEFDNNINLTTGHSMTILWEKFRRAYPQNPKAWALWNELCDLCLKFDNVRVLQFSESNNAILSLKSIFETLFDDILTDNIDDFGVLVQKLSDGITSLEAISEKFLNKRKHFFIKEFDTLMRILALSETDARQQILDIGCNSSISTRKLISLTSTANVYPPVFDLLWVEDDGKFSAFSSKLVTSSYFEDIITKANNFNRFSGSQIVQTLSDANILLSSTIMSSEFILRNQYSEISSKLLNWIKAIIEAHIEIPLESMNKQYLVDRISHCKNEIFKHVFDKYLLTSITFAQEGTTDDKIGEAWVLFGLAMLVLYAPDVPYDPAVHDYVLYDLFSQHKLFSEHLLSSWNAYGRVVSGDNKVLATDLIISTSDDDCPEKPRVFRGKVPVDNLIDEWMAFLRSTVSFDQTNDLFESMDTWSSVSEGRYEMFQQNTSNFLRRLESGYGYFSDLNDIFAGYIYSMKFGFDLIKETRTDSKKDINLPYLWSVDPLTLTNSEAVNLSFDEISKFIKTTSIDNLSTEKVLIFYMELFKFHSNDKLLIPSFTGALQSLYYRWSLRRMKDERESMENSKLFKYEDKSDDSAEDFKKMFPDYEDSLSLEDDSTSKGNIDLDSVYYDVAKSYISIFGENHNMNLSSLVKHGSEITETLILETRKLRAGHLKGSTLSSTILTLFDKIQSYSEELDTKEFDFYRASSVSESKKAVGIIDKLWKTVNGLHIQWPEHATLNELERICHEFLMYSADTPLARQLQKIEQIYTFVAEWEKYAASHVSLNNHINNITDLIVSWRKLELHTWKGLFNTEDKNIEKSIGKWWFYLFETIIVANTDGTTDGKDTVTSLLGSLNTFFSKSTLGEFKIRLLLVGAFRNHVELVAPKSTFVVNALQNSLNFYEQFVPAISEQLTRGRKALEKDVNEVILLASWKDVNVDALKQSSHKSHNNLYKLVRKYRTLLSGSVLSIIETGLIYEPNLKLSMHTFSNGTFAEYDLDDAKKTVNNIATWKTRNNTLKNIDLVSHNMQIYSKKIKEQSYPLFEDLVKDFAREANRLRDETPGVYKKEIKKELAALKVQKGKLLSDALKELRRIGLKTSFREDIHKVQGTSTSILANSFTFDGTVLENSDTYFFRILDLLPRLRTSVASPSDDVPITSIERGMAIIENLMFSLITTREPIQKLAVAYKSMEKEQIFLSSVCSSSGSLTQSNLTVSIKNFHYMTEWLPKIIDYALQTIKVIEISTHTNCDTTLLVETQRRLTIFGNQIDTSKIYDAKIAYQVSEFKNFIVNFVNQLNASKNSNNYFVYDIILTWINDNVNSSVKYEVKEEPLLDDVDNVFRKVFTSIILAFQKLMENDLTSISDDDDNWLTSTAKSIMGNIKSLHSATVLKNLQNATNLLRVNDFSSSSSLMIRAIVTFTLPVINQYFTTMRAILSKTRTYYISTSHGSYILANILSNLSKNGFCSPQPPSEEVDDNNLHEGTGLGDGEGAQNNSKDIEQDEDLTEDAQTANKDQKEQDEADDSDENDDAVDMEGDMAGEMENLSDQDDKDEEMSSEEENELDEQIDDLNEDDPNAIDDKMWDEQADDDSKEKDTEKNLDSKDDEDVQAGNDEDNDADNGENEGKDQDEQESHDDEIKNEQEKSEQAEDNDNKEDKNDEDAETGDEEEDVGEQEDEVKNEEGQEMDSNVPEVETMELPDDMQLDSGEEDEEEGEGDEEEGPDNLEEDEDMNIQEHEDSEQQPEEGDNMMEEVEEHIMDLDENDENNENESENEEEQTTNEGETDENAESPQSDEEKELKEESMQDEEKQERGGDDNAEGLDGVEDLLEEETIDAEAAVQQQSGSKGAGSDSKDDEEQENVGNSGNTQNDHENDQEKDENENIDSNREEATEALKQLGDTLKEFHRRRQEIKEASENAEEENAANDKANERPDDFEHVDGANTETDTQALGSANQDQLQSIDEDKAIDDDIMGNEDEEEEMKNDEDHDMLEEEKEIPQLNNGEDDEEEVKGDTDKNEEGKKGGVFAGENSDEFDNFNKDEFFHKEDYEDELDMLMDEVDDEVNVENKRDTPLRSIDESRTLWRKSELSTADLVSRLGEQLRLILEPTLATKLRGDYKTGKRLNMKRIIPYIASQFRKDKIWLRRTKPSKREYQIMIALDNSKSMSESKCVKLAFDSLCLVSKTLTQLESGGLSIVRFGEHSREVHSFNEQFSNESGAKAFQWFDFQDTKTDVKKLVAESIKIFERGRALTNSDQWQLQIVISDGICEDHETIKRLVRRARENKIMLVFVIIDGISSNESIMDMSQVSYVPDANGNLQLKINKYLDSFPFEFYVVVHDITELPEMLSIILRQYFSDLASS